MTVLTTERLILSPVVVEDLEDLMALWRDEAFTRPIAGRGPFNEEEVWFRLLRDLGHWQALDMGNWSMRLRSDGSYVGSMGILHYRREVTPRIDAPELGWGVCPRFQGVGLAREGLEAALAWADHELDAPRTVCMINPDNGPSLKLADRAGYRVYTDGAYNGHSVLLLERLRAARPGSAA